MNEKLGFQQRPPNTIEECLQYRERLVPIITPILEQWEVDLQQQGIKEGDIVVINGRKFLHLGMAINDCPEFVVQIVKGSEESYCVPRQQEFEQSVHREIQKLIGRKEMAEMLEAKYTLQELEIKEFKEMLKEALHMDELPRRNVGAYEPLGMNLQEIFKGEVRHYPDWYTKHQYQEPKRKKQKVGAKGIHFYTIARIYLWVIRVIHY